MQYCLLFHTSMSIYDFFVLTQFTMLVNVVSSINLSRLFSLWRVQAEPPGIPGGGGGGGVTTT
jgi:hypothetical protein